MGSEEQWAILEHVVSADHFQFVTENLLGHLLFLFVFHHRNSRKDRS